MRVIIIEDEQLTANRLNEMLKKYDAEIEILAVLPSVEESVEWFKINETPDLVFMDIHLEDGQCFSIFETINLEVPVIFTTAYDEYMIKAFKVNSVDYLMKPLNYEELVQAIEKYKKLHAHAIEETDDIPYQSILQAIREKDPEFRQRFLISTGSRLRTIDLAEIAYFYSAEKITFLVTLDQQKFPFDVSIDKLQMQLDPRLFFRVNRRFFVKFEAITQIQVYPKGRLRVDLNPATKEEVMVSIDRVTEFKDWLGR